MKGSRPIGILPTREQYAKEGFEDFRDDIIAIFGRRGQRLRDQRTGNGGENNGSKDARYLGR